MSNVYEPLSGLQSLFVSSIWDREEREGRGGTVRSVVVVVVVVNGYAIELLDTKYALLL